MEYPFIIFMDDEKSYKSYLGLCGKHCLRQGVQVKLKLVR